MSGQSVPDLQAVRAVAVHTEDVLDALEARERTGRNVVLRMLPPFSGRMRARIHVVDGGDEAGAVHFHPGVFVDPLPAYPQVDDTGDELREQGEYDVEIHKESHEQAVAAWRETVRSRRREELRIRDPDVAETVTLQVGYLG